MRIVFTHIGNFDYKSLEQGFIGGTEYQILGLSREFSKKGHEVFIIIGDYRGSSIISLSNNINLIRVKIPARNVDLRISPLKALAVRLYFSKVVIDVLKKLEPDFILMTEPISSYLISDINLPKIFITHNFPYGLLKSYISFNYYVKLGLPLLEELESHVFSNSDYIIALNKTIMYYLYLKGFERIKVIPNGVAIGSDVKPYDGDYILYGGRLTPEKGVLYLLLAYKKLSEEEDIDQKLVIVGSGSQEELLKSYARSIKEKVIFIPFLPQHKFLEVLAGCSIFVLPSLYEASPVTILQAMSLGKPVIASNVPGSRDLIMHGITGFLFEARDINALKEYLKLLIFDFNLRYKIGSKAIETVLKNYTFEKIADEYLKLLNELKYE